MPIRTQSRTVVTPFEPGVFTEGTFSTTATGVPYRMSQVTTSFRSGTPTAEELALEARPTRNAFTTFNPRFDNGHEFNTFKSQTDLSHKMVNLQGVGGVARSYSGQLIPVTPLGVPHMAVRPESDLPRWDENSIREFGTRAVKATRPLQSEVSIATLLGELKSDGLPRLALLNMRKLNPNDFDYRTKLASSLGGEYLNNVFGWKPLLSDVIGLCKAVVRVNDTIRQLDRDSGRNVRRSFHSPAVNSNVTSDVVMQGLSGSAFQTATRRSAFIRSGDIFKGKYTVSKYERMYFKGAYTYYLPPALTDVDKMVGFEARANAILGTRLTPEVLWNLAPWTWLYDWFGNVGDIISNATALSNDNLVMRYGYAMRKTQISHIWTTEAINFYSGNLGSLSQSSVAIRKERVRATPFGFGLNTELFSPVQWSILAALGMTKSERTLRLVS